MARLSWVAGLAAAVACGPLGAYGQDRERHQVPLEITYRHVDWVAAPPAVDDADSADPVTTYTVLASRFVAVHSGSDEPFADGPPQLECDPADVVSGFALEKREFLLGEPILVNYSLALNGPGEWPWTSGGSFDGSGREGGFAFVMRGEDGPWLSDFFPVPRLISGSVLSSARAVKKGSPASVWLAVQQWCAITKPGRYDLYCLGYRARMLAAGEDAARSATLPQDLRDTGLIYRGGIVDAKSGEASTEYEAVLIGGGPPEAHGSPIVGWMPPELASHLGEAAERVDSVAHYRISIREGAAAERRRMVESWTARAESAPALALSDSPGRAARDAILSARQDDFLPTIAEWVRSGRDAEDLNLSFLALRRDTRATAILLAAPRQASLRAFWRLNATQIPAVIPTLIEWLGDDDHEVRAQAESLLCDWSGRSFGRGWTGYNWERPTLEEGRAMQPLWRGWWKETKARSDFVPDRSRWHVSPDE